MSGGRWDGSMIPPGQRTKAHSMGVDQFPDVARTGIAIQPGHGIVAHAGDGLFGLEPDAVDKCVDQAVSRSTDAFFST
jgi:hypothetical protein